MDREGKEFRRCTCCGKKMAAGYVIDDGCEYFCDDDCLHAYYTPEEYDEMCAQDVAYWTEWESEVIE